MSINRQLKYHSAMKVLRSKYFIPFQRDVAESNPVIARMLKGGFIHQEASGLFTFLPLGLRMLDKIIYIINQEHERVGAQKMLTPTLHDAELWKRSGRYVEYGGEMLKIYDRMNREFVYAPSAEELVTNLLTKWPINQAALPLTVYNIQWKFRDEIRPRFAIVRAREFLMKDAYSFDSTKEGMLVSYEKMFEVYSKIFAQLGLNVCTFAADVGLMGGEMSHEFVVPSQFGETCINYEKWPDQPINFAERDNAKEAEKSEQKYCEIGHIYALGRKYTDVFKLCDPTTRESLYMGCYGIGVSRLMAVVFEQLKHDLGEVAPFKYVILAISQDSQVQEAAMNIYDKLDDVVFDDRDIRYGEKCAEADLIGAPIQIHVGQKELQEGEVIVKRKGEKVRVRLKNILENGEVVLL